MDSTEFTRVDTERRIMSETVVEKTWEIPAHGAKMSYISDWIRDGADD